MCLYYCKKRTITRYHLNTTQSKVFCTSHILWFLSNFFCCRCYVPFLLIGLLYHYYYCHYNNFFQLLDFIFILNTVEYKVHVLCNGNEQNERNFQRKKIELKQFLCCCEKTETEDGERQRKKENADQNLKKKYDKTLILFCWWHELLSKPMLNFNIWYGLGD